MNERMIAVNTKLINRWMQAGIMAITAMTLLLPSLALAQDNDNASKPAVVQRQKPEKREQTEPVRFKDDLDFQENFDSDFSVTKTPRNMKITLDFRDAELSDVVKLMSAQTGRNFIVTNALQSGKKITIISPNPVTIDEAYRAFLSALEMNGLTVVKSGRFYKIVPTSTALKSPIKPTWGRQRVPNNDSFATHIIALKHIDVSQIKSVLDQLKSSGGVIYTYEPTNTLIITDTGAAINRMLTFIKRMDTSSAAGEKMWIYQIKHAEATEIEATLNKVFDASSSKSKNKKHSKNASDNDGDDLKISQIVADERTNRLIIVADDRSYARVRQLIQKLDIEIPDSGRINVVHLQNSKSIEVASVLDGLVRNILDQQHMKQVNGNSANRNANNNSGALLQGEVSIVPNEASNDLVIVASPRDFLSLKPVIKELDRPRRQVFVEAVIMEISVERSRDLGITMHGGKDIDTSEGAAYIVGRTELNGQSSLSPAAMFIGSSSAPGLLASLVGPSLKIGSLEVPAIGMMINALQTNTDVNVLSTPTILTLDNQEAKISVGERIPYITNTGNNAGNLISSALGNMDQNSPLGGLGGLGSFIGGNGTQISRVDIALTLTIKPQINDGGTVKLEVTEEIEEVKPGGSDLGGPTTRMRQLQTVVVVPDQQTIVLGGLVRDSESQSVSQVPILGDIPVLGYLFRSTKTQVQKQNLLLMLTPYIIESYTDLEKIRIRKEKEREEFVKYFGRKDLDYARSVNYDKKHGIVEDMHQTILEQEKDAEMLQRLENEAKRTSDIDEQGIELPTNFSAKKRKSSRAGENNTPATSAPPETQNIK